MRLLDVDPDLGAELTEAEFHQARHHAVVEVASLEPGMHDPQQIGDSGLLGLLIIEGLLIRQVQVAERRCGELVGPGSIVRPWDNFGEYAPVAFEVSWRVLEPVELVLLDSRLVLLGARWPELIHGILCRAVERCQGLAFDVAIHSLRHIELRLLVLFWHLADRFGRVTSEGTVVPLPLSHSDIAELIGSQRPSVSVHLSKMAKDGVVARREDRTWILLGEPPAELRDIRANGDEFHRSSSLGTPVA